MESRRSSRKPSTTRTEADNQPGPTSRSVSNKRKIAENSQVQPAKRSAFGDITNRHVSNAGTSNSNGQKKALGKGKQPAAKKKALKSLPSQTDTSSTDTTLTSSQEISCSIITSSQESVTNQSSQASVDELNAKNLSQGSVSDPLLTRGVSQTPCTSTPGPSSSSEQTKEDKSKPYRPPLHIQPPEPESFFSCLDYDDIDKENADDVFQSPEYAQDIFNYYRRKELDCLVDDYMTRQREITPAMRAVLVDWLVEVQENFELNHETLYLAVRLVDHYLMRHSVTKETLQLVGAAAIFIACKFDERIPPMVDDFLYICDDAYVRTEFVRMEKDILRTVDFNLGMPISYRFLRRLAKAGKKSMQVLTLARYINETVLMSYKIVQYKESLIAAGCLRLAMKMMEPKAYWCDTLMYYSGYREEDLIDIIKLINNLMLNKNSALHTVENKYSHPVFYEVAKKPLLPTASLFPEVSRITTSATYV